MGIIVTWETAAQAFREAFEEILLINMVPSTLSRAELLRTEQLMGEKYANDSWTKRT